MAPRKKKPQKIKFELTKNAIGGIAVVVFCMFVWTFIFGVWAGQSLLAPQRGKTSAENTLYGSPPKESGNVPVVPQQIRAKKKPIKKGT